VKLEAGLNSVTINRGGSDTIDGSSTKVIAATSAGCQIIADTDPAPDVWTAVDFGVATGNMTVDSFTGDGSTVNFTLTAAPSSKNNTWVSVGGVVQQKASYSVSGTTLTFTSAPPNAVSIECVSGTTVSIGVPGDGTVNTAKLADNSVTNAKLGETITIAKGGTGQTTAAAAFAAIAVGTSTNNNATAGNLGEYLESVVGFTAYPATTVYGDLASISLTAGDWDVSALINQRGNTPTNLTFGISTTSGNSTTGLTDGSNKLGITSASSSSDNSGSIPNYRLSLSATTTVYLKVQATYASGSPTAAGRISARRVR
jgi:hypothetical protein